MSRFFETAEKHPEKVAITDGSEKLTYAELDRLSGILSTRLSDFGVGSEFVVGISLKPSIELVVCILAIWRAGGAYLPLDPGYPGQRLRYMLADSGCQLLLTTSKVAETLRGSDTATWTIDQGLRSEGVFSGNDGCQRTAQAAELAYIIYTSGSTGEPKGVEGTHRSLVNRLDWGLDAFPTTPNDVCCLKTSISFLDSLSEILTPLLGGCLLKIVPDGLIKNIEAFVNFLSDECVTRLVAVPSLLKLICTVLSERGETLPSMAIVVSSGEALSSSTAADVFSMIPNARLVNLYGSSEIGADVTVNVLTDPSEATNEISIGFPLTGVVCVVLDDTGRPVEDGVCGELHIGGVCLARGYRNKEKETHARFIEPSADLGLSTGRLFRTGDVVSRCPDGSLSFVGRTDDQVKIGGVRIELAEVERAILSFDTVSEVMVAALERELEDRYLAAFIVVQTSGSKTSVFDSVAELKMGLAHILPPMMIPTHFEVVPSLPLNPNGKLDRRALRLGLGYVPLEEVANGTLSSTQEKLAQVWAEILELDTEEIQINSDFHLLGGNSFALLKLLFRCSKIWECPIDIPLFLANPTLAAMAKQIVVGEPKSANLSPYHSKAVVAPLSPSQRRLLDGIEISAPRICNHNIEFLYEVDADTEKLSAALVRFLSRHEVFRVSEMTLDVNGQLIQKFDDAVPEHSEIETSDNILFHDFARDAKACRDAINPRHGRLYHFRICCDATGTTYFYGLINHLIFDGYSQFLMLSELSSFILDPERSLATPLGFGARSILYHEDATRASLLKEIPYWTSIVREVPDRSAFADMTGSGDSRLCTTYCVLPGICNVLRQRGEWFRSNVALAICAFAVGKNFELHTLGVRIVGSNRLALEGVDDSLTVGYVSDHYPQKVNVGETLAETVSNVLEARSAVPRRGAGYSWLRHAFNVPELVNGAQIDDFPMHFNFLPESDDFALFVDRTELLGPPAPYLGDDDYQGIAFFAVEEEGCLKVGIYRNSRFVSDEAVNSILETLRTSANDLEKISFWQRYQEGIGQNVSK